MNQKIFFKLSLLILILSVSIIDLFAQEQNDSTGFKPVEGQKGKDVIWIPTPAEMVDTIMKIAEVTPDDIVMDLGSGDGRIVISAAKLGARAIGIEYNHDMVTLSREIAKKEGVADKVEFIEGDIFEADLSKATVITMFLLPEINLKLRPRLLELKSGTRIVANTFTMGWWISDYQIKMENATERWKDVLLWIVPAKVEGKWKFLQGELTLKQKFQMVRGSYTGGGKTTLITDGRLRGDLITFSIEGESFTGKVNDGTMSGTFTNNITNTKIEWSAERVTD